MKNGYYQNVFRALGGKNEQFIQGDIAVAYGALLAGCTYFAGYPITPATEIAEVLSKLMPRLGGTYIQMEDEIASIAAIIGASWTGVKAMTATSGPGFSLMQENIGYGCMTESPCVIIDVQRSGPSTGQPTEAAQGDMMQARWGTHGDHRIIALCPSGVQECLDLTIEAFNLAEKYRNPVLVMIDGDVGHMREKVKIPAEEDIVLQLRTLPEKSDSYVPFAETNSGVSHLPNFGSGFHLYVTGLTHDKNGYPATDDPKKHTDLVSRLCEKISAKEDLCRVEKDYRDGARVAIVSYGITSRAAISAAKALGESGTPADSLRLIIAWPFPERQVRELAEKVDVIYVPEMNLGQMIHPIREAAKGLARVESLPKIGGVMHTPTEIVKAIQRSE